MMTIQTESGLDAMNTFSDILIKVGGLIAFCIGIPFIVYLSVSMGRRAWIRASRDTDDKSNQPSDKTDNNPKNDGQ